VAKLTRPPCGQINPSPTDFCKDNSLFVEIKDVIYSFVPKKIASNDSEIESNKNEKLKRMDQAGIKDGRISKGEEIIDDKVSEEEKDMASVIAALKTIEVLGQILKNYPTDIGASDKLEIINEIRKLGMRSVEAIVKTIGLLEPDLVDYYYERKEKEDKVISKDEIKSEIHKALQMLVALMARSMIHLVSEALNSCNLIDAASFAYMDDQSISSKLILLDLKMNCLNDFDYIDVKKLRESFEDSKEEFAISIVDSIVGQYLNYNKCSHELRSKLSSLCGFKENKKFIASQRNLLN